MKKPEGLTNLKVNYVYRREVNYLEMIMNLLYSKREISQQLKQTPTELSKMLYAFLLYEHSEEVNRKYIKGSVDSATQFIRFIIIKMLNNSPSYQDKEKIAKLIPKRSVKEFIHFIIIQMLNNSQNFKEKKTNSQIDSKRNIYFISKFKHFKTCGIF